MDCTSILRFAETRWKLASLTRAMPGLTEFFDFSNPINNFFSTAPANSASRFPILAAVCKDNCGGQVLCKIG